MKKNPFFREATSADLPNLTALLQDDNLGKTRENVTDLAAYKQAFQAILADPNHFILVIESNRELLGCVQVSYLPNLTFKGSWRAQFEGVRISSKHRGKGLGRQLINEAIVQAKARGCKIAQLTTNNTRPEAITFYESLGFQNSHVGMKLYYDTL